MSSSKHAKLSSRLLAILYDILIVFFSIVITIVVIQLILGQGKEIPADSIIHKVLKSFWLILSFLYFAYYWTKRGQTPGMKVWKVEILDRQDGTLITWRQAALRYIFALFGFGLLWIPFNNNRQALQDILSKSTLIKV